MRADVTAPRSAGASAVRVMAIVLLVLVGLVVGAIAGLFVAGWLDWLPKFNFC